MANLVQTVTMIDKSGKVVSTSKQLLNVFKEAKLAYRERKAEIAAERQMKAMANRPYVSGRVETITDDSRSAASSRRSHRGHRSKRRPSAERHHSGSSHHGQAERAQQHPQWRIEQDLHSSTRRFPPTSPVEHAHQDLVRRHTEQDLAMASHHRRPSAPARLHTTGGIDMDLAYGEFHAPSLAPSPIKGEDQAELNGLVSKARVLLDEANCAQHSVTAIISHLQKNPDAMAAMALTLAEISNIASKMAPGALTALKGSAPAVFALLASPEFLIAAGVGIGITVVMFGGYKIIKKIKAKNEAQPEMEEMMEVATDVNRIEHWRRGIAEVQAESAGTTVDGEFITPVAAEMSRLSLAPTPTRVEELKSPKSAKKSRYGRSKADKAERSSKGYRSSSSGTEKEKKVKAKKPSPLRLMFH